MSLTATEIAFLMKQAKELGGVSLKVDGLEIHVVENKATPKQEETRELTEQDIKELEKVLSPHFEDYSDEEILYFATPYFDELQAKKQAMAEQRKQDEGLRDG